MNLMDVCKHKRVIVAIDHGLSFGAMAGLENPMDVTRKIAVNPLVDGIIASQGVYKQAERLGIDLSEKVKLLVVDYVRSDGDALPVRRIVVEPGEGMGMSAYKLFLNMYDDEEELLRNITDIKRFIAAGKITGVPTLAETMFFGNRAFKEPKTQAAELNRASRLAMELGSDFIKIPLIENVDALEKMLAQNPLPTYILGGAKADDLSTLKAAIAPLRHLPVAGVMFGRNVWQSENFDETIEMIYQTLNP